MLLGPCGELVDLRLRWSIHRRMQFTVVDRSLMKMERGKAFPIHCEAPSLGHKGTLEGLAVVMPQDGWARDPGPVEEVVEGMVAGLLREQLQGFNHILNGETFRHLGKGTNNPERNRPHPRVCRRDGEMVHWRARFYCWNKKVRVPRPR